ncbi:MAG: glycosyltransferase [Crocinitomicaceae bacterium]
MSEIIILTEIGEKIGFGHFSRCSSIAKKLAENFLVKIYLHVKGKSDFPLELGRGIEVIQYNWLEQELPQFQKTDFVIIDSYLAPIEVYNAIESQTALSLAIDDYYRLKYPTLFILNPNVSADERKYINPNRMTGNQFVILREPFIKLDVNDASSQLKQICITVGGSDYRNLIPKFCEQLTPNFPNIAFHILTANQEYKKKLEEKYPQKNLTFHGFLNAEEMVEIFQNSDIAVSASGQTLGELVMTSTPFVAFCVDIDQHPIQQFYLDQKLIQEKIEWDDEYFIHKIENGIINLKDVNKRQQFIEKSRMLIDGKGVERICERIISELNGI